MVEAMSATISDRHGVKVLSFPADGPTLATDRDAVDLIAETFDHHPDIVVVPAGRFDDGFFTLSTRVAGEIVQKFVNYQVRLAIIGDISRHLEASSALRDYVRETNRGRQVWFVADLDELDAQLERVARH
jgi:uncharacterized protein DUF4180